MTEISLADRIYRGDRVKVKSTIGNRPPFTIQRKQVFALTFYGIIPHGRKRVPRTGGGRYRQLSRAEVENWADTLTLVEVEAEHATIGA